MDDDAMEQDQQEQQTFKLKLKLTAPLVLPTTPATHDDTTTIAITHAQYHTTTNTPLHIGARGGAALKELLSTAPNPEEAIRDFQTTHGLNFNTTRTLKRGFPLQHDTKDNGDGDLPQAGKRTKISGNGPKFAVAERLLDLLHVTRSSVYHSLLDKLMREMLLRIEELSQEELQRVLEATFPYIEFRELRKIPIAILARQDDTPEMYLRELTENRRIMQELPVHVRRKILLVDKQELQFFVEQCTQEYIEEKLEWYLKHPGLERGGSASTAGKMSASAVGSTSNGGDLWNVTSHMPSAASRHTPSGSNPWYIAPEERRKQSVALTTLTEMIGDSETLYLSTVEILKEYVVAAYIPGSTNAHAKEYVDYVPFLGTLRCDLANIQRDKTTALLRSDPLHKFIWFLDRAIKNQSCLDLAQLHELLAFIKRLRVADLPLNKKFKKGGDNDDEEENFEVVLGPPPVDQLLMVLDKISKADTRAIFAEPVPDDVPNYKTVIKDPMDLSTMRKRAKKGKYKSLEMFTDDFNLMIRNCMTFNPDTTIFYKEGKRVGKRGLEIIDKHAVTLRGEPQRIRAKKRKKSGTAETMTMLTSAGVTTLKDFGDVDQTGMVMEGLCDEQLADVAMILSDPHVKATLCESLLKSLVGCLQRRELPTDSVLCRGLVQLLQLGNPTSVRRMLRKKEYVLRAPQVVTMRVVLPLLLRVMVSLRGNGTQKADGTSIVADTTLWQHALRPSAAIRSVCKAYVLQCLKDLQIVVASTLLDHLVAVDGAALFRDRVFLHAVGELVLHHVKSSVSTTSSSSAGDAVDLLRTSPVWKSIVDGFFVRYLDAQSKHVKEVDGSIVSFEEADEPTTDDQQQLRDSTTNEPDVTECKRQASTRTVKAFAVSILHEKTVMVLASAIQLLEKQAASIDAKVLDKYLTKTLGMTRLQCTSLDEFESLWASAVFQNCRELYELLLTKCPTARDKIFANAVANGSSDPGAAAQVTTISETATEPAAGSTADVTMNDVQADTVDAEEKEAGELEEGEEEDAP